MININTDYYLHIESKTFGFYVEGINNIDKNKDILISKSDYDKFFENQSKGKMYRLKEHIPANANNLFDYLEECTWYMK